MKNITLNSDFSRLAKDKFPSLKGRAIRRKNGLQLRYDLVVPVVGYESRKTKIYLEEKVFVIPRVFVDGEKKSKHRYEDDSLCMWYPGDSDENKWVFSDGLLSLIRHIEVHLFKEAYWRDTGEWLGAEYEH